MGCYIPCVPACAEPRGTWQLLTRSPVDLALALFVFVLVSSLGLAFRFHQSRLSVSPQHQKMRRRTRLKLTLDGLFRLLRFRACALRRDSAGQFVVLHALSSFQRTEASLRLSASRLPTDRPFPSVLGEPSKVTSPLRDCQPLFAVAAASEDCVENRWRRGPLREDYFPELT